jgi:hypothetical protein
MVTLLIAFPDLVGIDTRKSDTDIPVSIEAPTVDYSSPPPSFDLEPQRDDNAAMPNR